MSAFAPLSSGASNKVGASLNYVYTWIGKAANDSIGPKSIELHNWIIGCIVAVSKSPPNPNEPI